MNQESFYVEALLKAEEQANRIIKDAQKERDKKIKEARVAADHEIARYRDEKEKEKEYKL